MKKPPLSDLGRRTSDPPIAWLMKMTLDHPRLISLAAGFTDNASLPVEETRKLINGLLRHPLQGRSALQYGTTQGNPLLRQLTARHLGEADTGRCPRVADTVYRPDRFLITNGSQQLLYMAAEALCNPGDIVLLEDPTYFVFLGIAQSHGLRCRGIRMQADGLDLDHLVEVLEGLRQRRLLPRVKCLYLVSYYQNPSGITTSLGKKKEALRILRRYERHAGHALFLLEDAAYRELRFQGEDVPSALTLDPTRTLYTSTFSKPFATGARVGFAAVPDPLREVLLRIKANHDFGTAHLLQNLILLALESGAYQDHLARLRQRYLRKMHLMARAMERHFPSQVAWTMPRGGLYFWARLPRSHPTGVHSHVFKQSLSHNVLYVPGEFCYAPDPTRRRPASEMRLSFGGASDRDIPRGIARLGSVLCNLLPP